MNFPIHPCLILGLVLIGARVIAADAPIDRLVLDGAESKPGAGRHIVLVAGDDEYRSEETLPMFAKILAKHHGFRCTVLFSQDPDNPGVIDPGCKTNIPGLEALRDADLLILKTRFRRLPDEQMAEFDTYLKSGRPVIGLRTANHAFILPENSKYAHYAFRYQGEKTDWHNGFGRKVLGSWFFSHHGWHAHESTRGIAVTEHPILNGIEEGDIWGASDVYGVEEPIPGDDVELLLRGQVLAGMNPDDPPVGPGPYEHPGVQPYLSEGSNDKNNPMQALAWTQSYQLEGGKKGRVFSTTLGSSEDFLTEGSRRLVVNAVYWCFEMEIPAAVDVTPVGAWKPSRFEIFKDPDHWAKVNRRIADLVPKEPLASETSSPSGNTKP